MSPASPRFTLRNLNLPARLTVAAFLVSIGIGYFAALVQLHLHHATPGKMLPDADDAAGVFYGRSGMSQLERLLAFDEGKPFNGSGTMRQAFTTRSAGWKTAINRRAKEKKVSHRQAEEELRSERDGERLALLDWIRTGADKQAFESNSYVLSAKFTSHPITESFLDTGSEGVMKVRIASILESRCVRCHQESAGGQAAQVPLENFEQIHAYCEIEAVGGGVSTKKLAQSTHAHLLGFAMMYGLTGFLLTMTSYPGWLRAPLGFFPLVAQVVDIGLWWLGRLDPMFARAIVFTGAAVASGLFLQIVLSLFDLFGRVGKIVLIIGIVAAAVGGYAVMQYYVNPYLAREALSATLVD